MDNRLKKIKAFLFDLDGTLHVGDKAIAGAAKTIRTLKDRGYPCRFVTNTTTKTLSELHNQMIRTGLPILKGEITNTIETAVLYLRKIKNPTCYFVLNEKVKKDFSEFAEELVKPEYIIIGDIGNKWNYNLLNKIFNMMMNGSNLIALHKGRFWLTEEGLQMDIGAFIAGLEYVTGKQAIVLGKPSKEFFLTAINGLNVPPENIAMVGDDINNDVSGAQALGMHGILVKTGKYKEEYIKASKVNPDLIIDSVKDIIKLWD
jgi:HAD superfamily hydrolase (TIGR01458 family)